MAIGLPDLATLLADKPLIKPAIFFGLILAVYEIWLVHIDEHSFRGWFGHALHAVPIIIIFTFISMNLHFALSKLGLVLPFGKTGEMTARVILAIIIAVQVVAKSALFGGVRGAGRVRGTHETAIHGLIIGILVGASPYIWLLLQNLPLLSFLK